MKTIVIGGGASGMMAAIQAAGKGSSVTLLEKNKRCGRKILLTGNGRCNITNKNVNWQNYHGENPKFAASVLARFDQNQTMRFFEDLGIILVEEDEGRMFPRSQQAQSVVDVLMQTMDEAKVKVKYNQKVETVKKKEDKFQIKTNKETFDADSVVIATGGKTYPNTGSTGDGYDLAKQLGHNIIKPIPASVPLKVKSIICHKLQGVKVNAQVSLYNNEEKVDEAEDEIIFTHFGISGPAILKISRKASYLIHSNNENVTIKINFFPEYSQEEIERIVLNLQKKHREKAIENIFIGLLPQKIASQIIKYKLNLDPATKAKSINENQIRKIIQGLRNYTEKIDETLSWDIAQFTAGGVDVTEIDSRNMQSKIVTNVFFCGEVVDIDGDCGGYNLQWAWSSGFVAGRNC